LFEEVLLKRTSGGFHLGRYLGSDVVLKGDLTETTLLDYVRFQSSEERELSAWMARSNRRPRIRVGVFDGEQETAAIRKLSPHTGHVCASLVSSRRSPRRKLVGRGRVLLANAWCPSREQEWNRFAQVCVLLSPTAA
jgi:hypothetical protein